MASQLDDLLVIGFKNLDMQHEDQDAGSPVSGLVHIDSQTKCHAPRSPSWCCTKWLEAARHYQFSPVVAYYLLTRYELYSDAEFKVTSSSETSFETENVLPARKATGYLCSLLRSSQFECTPGILV